MSLAWNAVFREFRAAFLGEIRQQMVNLRHLERRGHDADLFIDMQRIGGRRTERAPGRSSIALRHDHAPDAGLARADRHVHRPRAAKRKQHEIPRIEPFLNRGLAHQIGHLEFRDLGHAARQFIETHAQFISEYL